MPRSTRCLADKRNRAAAQLLQEIDKAALVCPQLYRAARAIHARRAARFLRGHSQSGAQSAPRSPSLCLAALQSMRTSLGGLNPRALKVYHNVVDALLTSFGIDLGSVTSDDQGGMFYRMPPAAFELRGTYLTPSYGVLLLCDRIFVA